MKHEMARAQPNLPRWVFLTPHAITDWLMPRDRFQMQISRAT